MRSQASRRFGVFAQQTSCSILANPVDFPLARADPTVQVLILASSNSHGAGRISRATE